MKTKTPEGQLPAFFPDEAEKPRVELPYVGPGVERETIIHRAGTRLDHRWVHRIGERGRPGRPRSFGLLDESQRVFQTGGEMKNFVFWKLGVVSLPLDLWRSIYEKADWIEIIDHERNECWRIATAKFVKHAVSYNAGIGHRIGARRELWDVITADGKYRQGPNA